MCVCHGMLDVVLDGNHTARLYFLHDLWADLEVNWWDGEDLRDRQLHAANQSC